LVLAREVVLQEDPVDVGALVAQPLGFIDIGAVQLCIVFQFSRLLHAMMECLPLARGRIQATGFEQIASVLGQRDDRIVAVEANGLHQP
jgi:hypothetical protein